MNRLSLVVETPPHRPDVAPPRVPRLTLFGGATVDTAVGPITGRAAQRHRIALLALLATTRRNHRSRDQLAYLLWPDAETERGRRLLSDSIYRVNQALGGDVIGGGGDDVRLDRNQIACDVADLEAAADANDWRRVAELYAGPFLDGFFLPDAGEFDRWMEGERMQHARTAARALEALAVEARDDDRAAEAVDWWQRLAGLAPDDSRVAMELMRALETAGNRAGALRHARVHALLLRETLDVEPDRAVQELAERIAARSEGPPSSPASVTGALAIGATATTISRSVPVSCRTCIAVLPFKNLSEANGNSHLADGISEELMYLLTRMPGIRVASPTSALAYRDMRLDVREVARRLDATWILEGSVRRDGERLRIVAQLTDARNGYLIWSESFDRTLSDTFAIQSEVASAIVERLAPAVTGPRR